MKLLEVNNLKKVYGEKTAVDGVSFYLEEGETLGFLGPNGAGKSTTINILSTILKSDDGEIKFNSIYDGTTEMLQMIIIVNIIIGIVLLVITKWTFKVEKYL